MPIQFPDWPHLSFAEANPWLTGAQAGMNMLEQGQKFGQSQQLFPEQLKEAQLMNALKQVQAQYAKPMAEQGLLKAKQENQWYVPNVQSEIALRGAQTKQAQAGAGLTGEQAKQLQYFSKVGYPTEEMRTLSYLQNGGQGQPGNASMNAQTTPSFGQQPQAETGAPQQGMTENLIKQRQNQALDNQIYAGNAPPSTNTTGMSPLASAYIQRKYPDPNFEFNQNKAVEDYKSNNSAIMELQKEYAKESTAAQQLVPTYNKLENLYNNITTAKGRLGGKFPAFSPEASEFDKLIQEVVNANAKLLGGGRVFGYDFTASSGAKASRDLPEDAFIGLTTFGKSKAEDALEHQAFLSAGGAPQRNGLPVRSGLLEQAWNNYKLHRPSMNFEPGEFYVNNAYQNTWKDYLTPEALRSIAETGDYLPLNQNALKSMNIKARDIGTFHSALKKIDPKISKLHAIKVFENPDILSDKEFNKIKNSVPRNIILQMINNKMKKGGQ
jgi:hypothetical protein